MKRFNDLLRMGYRVGLWCFPPYWLYVAMQPGRDDYRRYWKGKP